MNRSPFDGSAVTRTVSFEQRTDDDAFLLAVLNDARERPGLMPYERDALDRLRDAIGSSSRNKESR